MKSLKKVTAVLLVIVLAFGMLACCGSDVPTTVTETGNVGA